MPTVIEKSFKQVSKADSFAVALQEDLQLEHLVCLAGLLLEYTAPYFPNHSSTLDGVNLHVYECVIQRRRETGSTGDEAPNHLTLLKFSIPDAVSEKPSLLPDTVLKKLKQTFGPRIESFAPNWDLEISHSTTSRDRIVF